ncbi:Ragulator complex LAMTOR3 [Brachionus plicatilis]|uniref:Ragulator complex LAMTOR3 n=1 Tax=Brachionus plicatilis TaxID=10195 RepID=A0A3M7SH26_BRAPC|nr:Ragulator complex LAMTOR3 [Brachionus plicatilis]
MDTVEYLDPEKNLVVYDNYKLHRKATNSNKTTRWRCQQCKSISITVNSDDLIVRKPNGETRHNPKKCTKYFPVQKVCIIEYERLKYEAKTDHNFSFSKRYREILQKLQSENDPKEIAEFFQSEETARVTCSSIRSSKYSSDPTSTCDFEIKEDQKYIQINLQKQLFLRFDNNNRNNYRILIFISDTSKEILQQAEDLHIDGTFKNSPKMFYQMVTVHAAINNQTYPCAYIFLQNKITTTYVIAFEQLRNICFPKNLKRVMIDFELALMKSVISVFPGVQLMGCWFHFTQAIRKNVFSNGLKAIYLNDWKFRFWIKRFMTLALIPIDKLQHAIDIIIEELPEKNSKYISFIKYFQKQWLNGAISPQIWNLNSQKRTNNDLEGFHSKLTMFLPKYHSKFADMIKTIKNEDAKTRNEFLKPNKTVKRDFEKDLQIQLIQEEYRRNAIDFKSYFYKLTQQVMSPYEQDLDDDQIEALVIDNNDDDKVVSETISSIKILKLFNEFESINFVGDIELKIATSSKDTTNSEVDQSTPKVNLLILDGSNKRKRGNKVAKEPNPKMSKREEKEETMQQSNITVDESIQIEQVNNYLEDDQWLMGRFLNLTMYNNWKIEECKRHNYLLHESPEVDKIFILNVKNSHWILLTNINPTKSSANNQWFDQEWGYTNDQEWFVYDCMNDLSNCQVASETTLRIKEKLLQRNNDSTATIHNMNIPRINWNNWNIQLEYQSLFEKGLNELKLVNKLISIEEKNSDLALTEVLNHLPSEIMKAHLEPRFNKLFNEKIIPENRHHEDSLKKIKREVDEYEEKTKQINDYYKISKEEIERILKGLKDNKGAGFNDVTNEMYKYGMSDTLVMVKTNNRKDNSVWTSTNFF